MKFNLSEKMMRCVCGNDDLNRRILFHHKDVKEFIRRLKEDMFLVDTGAVVIKDRFFDPKDTIIWKGKKISIPEIISNFVEELNAKIDKLAGEKLI